MTAHLTSFGEPSPESKSKRLLRYIVPQGVKDAIRRTNVLFHKQVAFAEHGTLNNQERREAVVKDLIRSFDPFTVIETGTYLGAGAKFFLENTKKECAVLTCEINPNFYKFCKERFRRESRIGLFGGSSVDFLERLTRDSTLHDKNIIFYLDAHWEKELPLQKEVEIILKKWPKALILIDDFVVPHDKGYLFDTYHEQSLDAAHIRGANEEFRLFYPSIPSERETGAKRGYCFVCRPDSDAYAILSKHPNLIDECQQVDKIPPTPWSSRITQDMTTLIPAHKTAITQ